MDAAPVPVAWEVHAAFIAHAWAVHAAAHMHACTHRRMCNDQLASFTFAGREWSSFWTVAGAFLRAIKT